MQLWTWQADEVKPTVGGVDPRRAGSYHDIFPKYRPAFERLWEMLGTDQLLWCFVDEQEAKESTWNGRIRGDVCRGSSLDGPFGTLTLRLKP